MDLCSKVATALQFVLNIKADELANNTGFIKLQRKATGSTFAKTLLFSWLQNSQPSVDGLVRTGFVHNLKMSAQGLDKRFTADAGLFMKSVLEGAAGRFIVAGSKVEMELLDRFTAVHVADCSTVTLPAEEAVYAPGSLRLQDLGYFNLRRMKERDQRCEYWISRLQPGTRIFGIEGEGVGLPTHLQTLSRQGVTQHEMGVKVGTEKQQVSTEHRHSGRDNGPVRARSESSHRDVKDRRHPESNMRSSKITVHGATYLHPCRYVESWTELCITMSAERGNDESKFRKVITDHTLSALITYNHAELEYFP
ncbi:hypothetical protein [Methylobacter sp.]|uniref:hypothetical protein n=1 Tax=Methylobacter sp. TaxID=2051955 RepID=UPI0024896AA3|nr:hypothetical protein [Methylobacter sp.]MDI1279679.1 hypothetical protein [Methylobacter sp.]MDI1360358.1 hypothetical protein [Methylobacter sp.]